MGLVCWDVQVAESFNPDVTDTSPTDFHFGTFRIQSWQRKGISAKNSLQFSNPMRALSCYLCLGVPKKIINLESLEDLLVEDQGMKVNDQLLLVTG